MKNVYLVQTNVVYEEKICNLPYSVGMLAAYAWEDERIKETYTLGRFIYRNEEIETSIASLDNPFLVGFSCYIWNFEYVKVYAKRLKEVYPDCYILLGGPSIHNHTSEQLLQFPYVDFLIHSEGEIPFHELLLALNEKQDFSQVSSLSYRNKEGEICKTEMVKLIEMELPSPYLLGYFDDIVDNEPYIFATVAETNRGCPYGCTFCSYSNTRTIRKFSMEKIKKEMAWLAEHKITYVLFADANFGILERDLEIIEILVENMDKHVYPTNPRFTFTKNSNDRVFEIYKRLHEIGRGNGVSLSLQSLHEPTLKAIRRNNLEMNNFSHLIRLYSDHNMTTYTELIVGLPEETYESFTEGINILLNHGLHDQIKVYNCSVLPNSEMAQKEYMEKYCIEIVEILALPYDCKLESDWIHEKQSLVKSTSSMPVEDWIQTNMFVFAIRCFHVLGATQYITVYLKNFEITSYKEFYQDFLLFLKEDDYSKEIYATVMSHVKGVTEGENFWGIFSPDLGGFLWPFEEYLYSMLLYDSDTFYSRVKVFLSKYNVAEDILEELVNYQQFVARTTDKSEVAKEFSHDWTAFFSSARLGSFTELKKETIKVKLDKYDTYDSLLDFANGAARYVAAETTHLYKPVIE